MDSKPPLAVSSTPSSPPHRATPSTQPKEPAAGGSAAPATDSWTAAQPPPVQVRAKALPAILRSRLRVSVKASARDPDLLVVRPLPEGKPLPPGTHEALLVLMDAEGDSPDVPNREGSR